MTENIQPRRVQRTGVLLVVLLLLGYWLYTQFIQPLPFYFRYDPELPYFMSSLSVFKGHPYVFVDHPGTPVEVLGTLILALTYPFTGGNSEQFVIYHLQNPMLFLVMGRSFLTFTAILSVILVARYAIRVGDGKDAVLSIAIAVSYFAIHPHDESVVAHDGFASLTFWSHNSFNLPLGTTLLLGLLLAIRSNRSLSWRVVALLGFAAGVLTAIQLYFAVWVICIFVTLYVFSALNKRPLRQTIATGGTVVVSSLVGFGVATIPIFARYDLFLGWVWRLFSSQGIYGTGERGFTSVESLTTNFVKLLSEAPHVVGVAGIVVITLVVILFLQRRTLDQHRGVWALSCGLVVHTLVLFFLILKHPQTHYLISISATMPILLAVIFSDLTEGIRWLRQARILIAALMLAGLLVSFVQAFQFHQERLNRVATFDATVQRGLEQYANITGHPQEEMRIFWSYATHSPCTGFWFGNEYADRAFTDELEQICVNEQMFNVWPDGVVLGNEFTPLERGEWDVLIAVSDRLTDFTVNAVADYTIRELGDNITFITHEPFTLPQ